MPIIKSAKKQMRQNAKRRVTNFRTRYTLKTAIKDVLVEVKGGAQDKAQKALQTAYKVIDTSAKKNIIHPNNAARKKSSLAKMVATMSMKKAVDTVTKAAKKAPAKAKKEVKETPVVEAEKTE